MSSHHVESHNHDAHAIRTRTVVNAALPKPTMRTQSRDVPVRSVVSAARSCSNCFGSVIKPTPAFAAGDPECSSQTRAHA